MNDPITHFLKALTRDYERLSEAEERRLLARRDEPEARRRLVLSILPWAVRRARRHCGPLVSPDDALSIACQAATKAVEKHDPAKGRLTSAVPWHVRRYVSEHLQKAPMICVPRNVYARDPSIPRRLRMVRLDDLPRDALDRLLIARGETEHLSWVWRAVDRLRDPRHRLVIRCRFLHGMKLREIARGIGGTKQWACMLLAAAMKKLQPLLEREMDE